MILKTITIKLSKIGKNPTIIRRQKAWEKRKDSINNDAISIYVVFPDSIDRFEREDMYELINHFNKNKLIVDSNDFNLNDGK